MALRSTVGGPTCQISSLLDTHIQPQTFTQRQKNAATRHSLESDSDSGSELPFPKPLPREAFLDDTFSPEAFLSTLVSRHQTLSDLQAELSSRSQTIASELLTLVNNEYQTFLGLGQDLKGGEEKIEQIRVDVMGFAKGVTGLKQEVQQRKDQVSLLLEDRKEMTRDISLARALLRVADGIEQLEEALLLRDIKNEDSWIHHDLDPDEDLSSDEADSTLAIVRFTRLQAIVQRFASIKTQIELLGGSSQPFLAIQQAKRIPLIHRALIMDLATALKQAREAGAKILIVKILNLYIILDDISEALRILKQPGSK